MTLPFAIVLIIAALFYAALIGFFAVGFRRVRSEAMQMPTVSEDEALPFVSVVVAARNEEAGIGACLHAIRSNDYPAHLFEIIVVDDGSDDATAARVGAVQEYQAVHADAYATTVLPPAPDIRLIRMADFPEAFTGAKNAALRRGIETAHGDILITTDADCIVGPRWIRTMVNWFTAETGFVAGPVRYRPGNTLFGKLQALEFLALVATGAGGMGMNRPNMCNSANVAYRRVVYDHFRALRRSGPGEDEVWAQRLAAETSWRVRFCAAPEALVETEPVLSRSAFWRQRRRWAGTGPRYPDGALVAAIFGVYFFYVMLLMSLVAACFVPLLRPVVMAVFGLKVIVEAALLYPACTHFGQAALFRYFIPEQLLQIPYVVFVGLAAATGNTHWKGRKVFDD